MLYVLAGGGGGGACYCCINMYFRSVKCLSEILSFYSFVKTVALGPTTPLVLDIREPLIQVLTGSDSPIIKYPPSYDFILESEEI